MLQSLVQTTLGKLPCVLKVPGSAMALASKTAVLQRCTTWGGCGDRPSTGSCKTRQHKAGCLLPPAVRLLCEAATIVRHLSKCQSSCRKFAVAYQQQQRPLHILVNNAGANYLPESYTEAGVGMLCQASFFPNAWHMHDNIVS